MSTGGETPEPAPSPPQHTTTQAPGRAFIEGACSQALRSHSLPSWEPRTHRPHPGGPSKRGRQPRCTSVPLGSSHSCRLFCVIRGTGHRHHPPPASAIEGSRAGPRAGAPRQGPEPLLLRASLGQLRALWASHPQVLQAALVLRQRLAPLLLRERAAAGVLGRGWRGL